MAREKEIIVLMKQQIDKDVLALVITWLINPPSIVSFGYLSSIKAWRANFVEMTNQGPVCLKDKNSLNRNELLDQAFTALEQTGAKLNIVLNDGTKAKFYP